MDDWFVDWVGRIIGGLLGGAVLGIVFSIIATILVLLSGRTDLLLLLQLALIYVIGGATIGAVMGAISDLAQWKWGIAMMGFIGGFGAYFGAMLLISGGEITKIHVISALILALIVGIPGAFMINHHY